MSVRPLAPLCIGAAFIVHGASAAAQPASRGFMPEPVSPGSFTQVTLAAACPSFSWAGSPGAGGYELAVHEVEGVAQLGRTPRLQTIVPGAATSWTPSLGDCLKAGAEYMWFVREIGPAGESTSGWSDGMRFRVAGTTKPAGNDGYHSPEPAGEDRPGTRATDTREEPPPSNKTILQQLQAVYAELRRPEPMFSFVLCTEPALQLELASESQVKLTGEIEGRAGAEGFGNGAMVKLQGEPASRLSAKIKGGWDLVKLGVCWDLGATVRNRLSNDDPLRPRDIADAIAGLDIAALQQKLDDAVGKIGIDPAAAVDSLQGLIDIDFSADPFSALSEDGSFRQVAQAMPLPPGVRSVATNPAQVLERFQVLRDRGLCNLDLPPALSGPVSDICHMVESEPFRPLLRRVDSTVETIDTVVDRIEKALPNAESCKFFCDGGFLGK